MGLTVLAEYDIEYLAFETAPIICTQYFVDQFNRSSMSRSAAWMANNVDRTRIRRGTFVYQSLRRENVHSWNERLSHQRPWHWYEQYCPSVVKDLLIYVLQGLLPHVLGWRYPGDVFCTFRGLILQVRCWGSMLLTKGGKHGKRIKSDRNTCTSFHGKLSSTSMDVITGQQTKAELRHLQI